MPDAFNIREYIKIICVQEDTCRPHKDGSGDLAPDATYWLHTIGMEQFKRPDLELRQVPALFIDAACTFLNNWASYTVVKAEIHAGQKLGGNYGVPVMLRAYASDDPFWNGRPALRLVVDRVAALTCADCGKTDTPGHAH